jgi:preprotein translocase SecE subunit
MAKDTKKIKDKKEKKDNKTFFKDFKAELKKVTWPTAKQLVTKTAVVIAIVLIISAIVLDFAFDKGYEFIVTKASSSINKDNTTDAEATDTNSTDETTTTEDNAVENAEENVTTEEGTAE